MSLFFKCLSCSASTAFFCLCSAISSFIEAIAPACVEIKQCIRCPDAWKFDFCAGLNRCRELLALAFVLPLLFLARFLVHVR